MNALMWGAPLLCFIAGACATHHQPIPSGNYVSEAGAEEIAVQNGTVHLHVHADLNRPDHLIDREYKYSVGYGEIIRFHPIASADPVLAHDYRWFSQYGRIARIDPHSGRVTWFSRIGCHSWTNLPIRCLQSQ